ncbi:LLM class flavin-dependent oxidoreductase [Sediminivirga luteola]|uniref:Putative monooxygenase (Luciferase-like) n=1 Tax=Sediminivirga luteola TaxID=1774748 RepID=A0A8J2XLS5_9MICO|nr:LLM class flavin-dependent oxidoreductase [Sediminivirga luteola]GGA25236.1 putative monooxygenase (luciferase-like) [Sediminivirga luteola]
MPTPLSVFDLVPRSEGSTPEEAIAQTLRLARTAEEAGYHRIWYGEHHLNPGVLGSSPALTIALAGAVTSRIRLGSAAVLAGHRTPLSIAEEFAFLSAAYPGRIDLGLGRAALRAKTSAPPGAQDASGPVPPGQHRSAGGTGERRRETGNDVPASGNPAGRHDEAGERRTPEGLLIPAPPDLAGVLDSPRAHASTSLLYTEGATPPSYPEFIDQVLAAFVGRAHAQGVDFPEAVVRSTTPQTWIMGSSAGLSAEVAGSRGLRFGANYHVAPSGVIDAVQHYRRAFRPAAQTPHAAADPGAPGTGGQNQLAAPYVSVSAEVLVAPTRAEAEHLSHGYDAWVLGIRTGRGAIAYPRPEDARDHRLTPAELALVEDRLATRFVGTPGDVVDQLRRLRRATRADELLISTITHDYEARRRSYELLARAWAEAGI